MATDKEIVKRLQQRLPEKEFHSGNCCTYNEQGQLTRLDLDHLRLTEVPPEVWQCSSLQELSLRYNQLSTLPAEIGQLTALQRIVLNDNQLSTLPT